MTTAKTAARYACYLPTTSTRSLLGGLLFALVIGVTPSAPDMIADLAPVATMATAPAGTAETATGEGYWQTGEDATAPQPDVTIERSEQGH